MITNTVPSSLGFAWADVTAAVTDFLGNGVVAGGLVLVIALAVAPIIVKAMKKVFGRR